MDKKVFFKSIKSYLLGFIEYIISKCLKILQKKEIFFFLWIKKRQISIFLKKINIFVLIFGQLSKLSKGVFGD